MSSSVCAVATTVAPTLLAASVMAFLLRTPQTVHGLSPIFSIAPDSTASVRVNP